jgi:luciferase family oxidoreductase group 1
MTSDSRLAMTPLSVLDLAPVRRAGSIAESFANSRDLARHVEGWGYRRFWLAEHHNIPGIASAATAVLIGYVAEHTSKIRIGAGGIMLPNHSSIIIAEQFGTLELLYPGRIDLGLGRAPGTDPNTVRAIRRDLLGSENFPAQLAELRLLLGDPQPGQLIRAIPGSGTKVPIWLLGSSEFSAQLAGSLGLPFAFAAHFQPDELYAALDKYRRTFRASDVLQRPYAMVALPVVAADTDRQARYVASSTYLSFLNLVRGQPQPVLPPVDNLDDFMDPLERTAIDAKLAAAIIGSPETVRQGLEKFLKQTEADELMIVTNAYNYPDRLRSYEIIKDVVRASAATKVTHPSASALNQ